MTDDPGTGRIRIAEHVGEDVPHRSPGLKAVPHEQPIHTRERQVRKAVVIDRVPLVAVDHGAQVRQLDVDYRPGNWASSRVRIDFREMRLLTEEEYLAHFAPAPRHAESWRAASLGFDEVNLGLPLSTAIDEARRCLNCGVCNDCELCMILCPDVAISRSPAGHGFVIDLEHCKGCGICAEECPRGAIVMTREGL